MGRLGTAEEVADVIGFLASPCAHWINGQNIAVDRLEQPYVPAGPAVGLTLAATSLCRSRHADRLNA